MISSSLPLGTVLNCWKYEVIKILNFSPYSGISQQSSGMYSLTCYCESFESIKMAKKKSRQWERGELKI